MREEAGRIRGARNQHEVDVEVPSFVDDRCMDIVDWGGGNGNMQLIEANVKRIVREVAEECRFIARCVEDPSKLGGRDSATSG